MSGKKKKTGVVIWLCLVILLLVAVVLTMPQQGEEESIKEVMRDAVLHENDKIDLFGIALVNPAVVSGFVVTGVLLLAAALLRIFAIPRFQYVAGKLQLALEQAVGLFRSLAESNSPHRNKFLGAYIFGAGVYIFVGPVFELFGLQATTVLPISMSFRLFGAVLSGLLVTELVYYYVTLSFVLPVVVAVLFTLLHALIQTYVLTMLTALFYGEVAHPHAKKEKKAKKAKKVLAGQKL